MCASLIKKSTYQGLELGELVPVLAYSTYLTQNADSNIFKELDVPDDALPSLPLPVTTLLRIIVLANAEGMDQDWVPPLKDLDIPNTSVGDVSMNTRNAMEVRTRTRTSGNGLQARVSVADVAKKEWDVHTS